MTALESMGSQGGQCDVAAVGGPYRVPGLMVALETGSSPSVKELWVGISFYR